MFDLQCPDAIRILDVPHAAQRLSHIAGAVRGEGSAAARTWQDEQITALKQHGPAGVLAAVEALAAAHPEVATVSEDAAYLTKRRALMGYPTYQAQGLPIASGCVESANKLVVEARLKGAGMQWQRTHVNPMVALRNMVCSRRWGTVWPMIQAIQRAAGRQAHRGRRARRRAGAVVDPPPAPARTPLPGGTAHPPPANHPWKRLPTCPGGLRHMVAQRAGARE